ncbi:hypothetical protein BaRGS_00022228, partial [Batillaria attramentaria]
MIQSAAMDYFDRLYALTIVPTLVQNSNLGIGSLRTQFCHCHSPAVIVYLQYNKRAFSQG